MRRNLTLRTILFFFLLVIPANVQAGGGDFFLYIEGIPGESTDQRHKGWIDVLSFGHGVALTGSAFTFQAGGGMGPQRIAHTPLTVVKNLDRASPILQEYCAAGRPIKQVILSCCRTSGDRIEFYTVRLLDVVVSGVKVSGDRNTTLPTEDVSFGYGKIEWKYITTDHKTGKASGTVATGWDLKAIRSAPPR